MVANLIEEMKDPAVEAAMKLLGARGLGVTVVHGHDDTSDEMTSLPDGLVQFEDDLQVRFLRGDDAALENATPVTAAWINGEKRVIGRCRQGHTRSA